MDTKTHIYITDTAIKILNNLGYSKINAVKDSIIHYSTQPDFDENEGAYKGHFYNPATGKNFADGYDNALSRFYRHYAKAKANKQNDLDSSNSLGRAIHYLEDLCTPVHTYNQDIFDAAINISSHVYFENKCDELILDIGEDVILGILSSLNYEYFTNNHIKDIGKSAALTSSILFDKYSKIKHKHDVEGICIQAIMNGIKYTTGVLYRYVGSEEEWV